MVQYVMRWPICLKDVNIDRSRPVEGTCNRHTITPSPPIKSLGFRGFDSSKLLILKGGNSHVRIIL